VLRDRGLGSVIPVKPWCTGKQLPLGFNPMDLGSVGEAASLPGELKDVLN